MSALVVIGIVVGVLFCIWLLAGAMLWLSRNKPWTLFVFGLIALASFASMIIIAIVAHANNHAPSQPVWLVAIFTTSLIIAIMILMATAFDNKPR